MALKFRSIRLPFVRVSQTRIRKTAKKPAATRRTFVWHFGPWQYNARTGQHTLKLTKKVRWVSKTKAQKATEAKAKAKQRAAWDKKVAETNGRPSTVPAKAAPAGQPTDVRAHLTTTTRRPGESNEQFLRRGRSEAMAAAGLCGARTRDGSSCLNAGHCPHHPRGGRS